MLITKKFVMLNFPKTGSTFARTALMQAHQPNTLEKLQHRFGLGSPVFQELKMRPVRLTQTHTTWQKNRPPSQHGVYMQIPKAHRSKMIMSVVRDPIERIVSLYEYKDWQKFPFPDRDTVSRSFPSFPELSFEEFLQLGEMNRKLVQPAGMQVDVGPLTTQFIGFYARCPERTLLALKEDTDLRADYDLHFPAIRYLHTENLNEELYAYLLELGYPKHHIAFITGMSKKNVSERTRNQYLTSEQIAHIHWSERFFYQLFPEYLKSNMA